MLLIVGYNCIYIYELFDDLLLHNQINTYLDTDQVCNVHYSPSINLKNKLFSRTLCASTASSWLYKWIGAGRSTVGLQTLLVHILFATQLHHTHTYPYTHANNTPSAKTDTHTQAGGQRVTWSNIVITLYFYILKCLCVCLSMGI